MTQYVRVQEVIARSTQLFYDNNSDGAFERDVIVFTTTTALLYDFVGQEVQQRSSIKPPTRIRYTNVSDASSYYGIRKLALAAAIGDLMVKVDSPYVPLVPTTQAETPVTDVLAGMGTLAMVQAGDTDSLTLSFSTGFAAGTPVTRYLGSPFTRGGVKVQVAGTLLTDDGRGALTPDAPSAWSGSVDYAAGAVSLANSAGSSTTSVAITATPAAPVLEQGFSNTIEVTEQNRQLNYVMQLSPLPYPGTVTVDYLALGKWIRLSDNGRGQLVGLTGQGSGTINYATGSLVVTLGALPDVDSAIIESHGSGVQTARRDAEADGATAGIRVQLPGTASRPGSVVVGYTAGGTPRTATDASGDGQLREGATVVGTVDYLANQAILRPLAQPDANTPITASSDNAPAEIDTFTPAIDGNGIANIDLGGAVSPGAVTLAWAGTQVTGRTPTGNTVGLVQVRARDDGAGNLVAVSVGGRAWVATLGTVNYQTGIVSVKLHGNNPGDVQVPHYSYGFSGELHVAGYVAASGVVSVASGSPVSVGWQAAGTAVQPSSVSYPANQPPPLVVDLTPVSIGQLVPGGVRFELGGHTFVDRNGSLFYDVAPATGAGTYGGTVDYSTGQAVVTAWNRGAGLAVNVRALLMRLTEAGRSVVDGRTPGAPLRPGSFVVRATTLPGVQLTATADINGAISGTQVTGTVDWRTGAYRIRFGTMVAAAGNEAEPWFDPDLVVNGQIFRPTLVDPGTVFIGTVVYRSIPLNPAILGLDPVRLPEDGRVLIFRPGQTALVHHSQKTTIASPTPGQVMNFGRPNVSRVEVRDSTGAPVDPIWFTVNRAAGTLAFANPLNLSAYALPIVVRDTIEDRVLVADVSITGEVELNRPLAHAYPSGAYLSTCLILGEQNGSQDLQARVENIFDQETWTGEFSDLRIGNGTDSQFNDLNYPVQVDNGNAITERWAIHFTNATTFELIGQSLGVIATGTTAQDFAPLNPRTGEPYLFIDKRAWGLGWAAGNALRLNTIGAIGPVWFIRTTLAGEMEVPTDAFRFEVIGDANP